MYSFYVNQKENGKKQSDKPENPVSSDVNLVTERWKNTLKTVECILTWWRKDPQTLF